MTATFDAFGTVVTDMAASLAFYRRLGLAIPAEADTEHFVEYTLPGDIRMMWCTDDIVRSYDRTWTPPAGTSRINLAFRCEDAADVDKVYDDLVAAGASPHLAPWDAVWGQRYAMLLDPDGNGVDLFAPLAE